MKRIGLFNLLSLLAMLSVAFTALSCSSDDDDDGGGYVSLTSGIVGSWSSDYSEDANDGYIFYSDGTGISVGNYDDPNFTLVEKFTYTIDETNRAISFVYDGYTDYWTNVSINGSDLQFWWDGQWENYTRKDFTYTDRHGNSGDSGDSSGGNTGGGSSSRTCSSCNGTGLHYGYLGSHALGCGGTGKCSECRGKGYWAGSIKCLKCGGSGKCKGCNGTGICPDCDGTGVN